MHCTNQQANKTATRSMRLFHIHILFPFSERVYSTGRVLFVFGPTVDLTVKAEQSSFQVSPWQQVKNNKYYG